MTNYAEELLIDFRELVGSHSGENLASAVWQTLELYELQGRVCRHIIKHVPVLIYFVQISAINCDNASNNDTMVDALARLSIEQGYVFDADEGRLRCMPHTVHLAALEASYLCLS